MVRNYVHPETGVIYNVDKLELKTNEGRGFGKAKFILKEGGTLGDLYTHADLKRDINGNVLIDDDGNVTINGKELKKIMVDGKEFFGGDIKTGLKNLPVDIIDKLKTYDKKSDLARITGIDDGEAETVLALTVKKGMN